jgi:hypothetical protein
LERSTKVTLGIVAGAGCILIPIVVGVVLLAGGLFALQRSPNGEPALVEPRVEEGVAQVPLKGDSKKGELIVFYKIPFLTPPSLTFPDGIAESCFVEDQKAESFKISRDVSRHAGWESVSKLKWRAEGLPGL